MFSLSFLLTSVIHCLLNRIKKFLGNNWLVASLINFVVKLKYAVVKMIFEAKQAKIPPASPAQIRSNISPKIFRPGSLAVCASQSEATISSFLWALAHEKNHTWFCSLAANSLGFLIQTTKFLCG